MEKYQKTAERSRSWKESKSDPMWNDEDDAEKNWNDYLRVSIDLSLEARMTGLIAPRIAAYGIRA